MAPEDDDPDAASPPAAKPANPGRFFLDPFTFEKVSKERSEERTKEFLDALQRR